MATDVLATQEAEASVAITLTLIFWNIPVLAAEGKITHNVRLWIIIYLIELFIPFKRYLFKVLFCSNVCKIYRHSMPV